MSRKIKSWGRVQKYEHELHSLNDPKAITAFLEGHNDNSLALAHGMGRSYGDSNLNQNGHLLKTTRLNAFLESDWENGIIKAQAGLTLDELLQVCVPKGWFLPVVPGSKFVTLGGAVANNVHGKNHHKVGSFGNFVLSLALHRSDRKVNPTICTPNKNKKLFGLTIGGLGLSGIIEWVEVQLKPIQSAYLYVENIRYDSLRDFVELSQKSYEWDYSVAWLDCFAKGTKLGRGIFTRGRFTDTGALQGHPVDSKLSWPFVTPSFFLNKISIKIFNWFYRHRPGSKYNGYMHYDPFFFPLDSIANWNRLYGKSGFFQYQCIISLDHAEVAITEMLQIIEKSGQGSFLAVLKVHGPETSPGILSFCRQGLSLALDFPNRGTVTQDLFFKLDKIVKNYGGCLYPAKDGHMSPVMFQSAYPGWEQVERSRDPKLSSSFWRRVTKSED